MRYLSALTTLRFVAAGMIVVHHVAHYFGYAGGVLGRLALDQGVSFFFVLSGFILFYRHGELCGRGTAWRFIAARIARIWPLHAATLALALLFVPSPFGPAGLAAGPTLANLALLQAWFPWPGWFFSWNAVSWSLSTEMFFYACYPALAAGWRNSWPWKLALCGLLAAGMVWAAARAGLGFYDGTERVSIDAIVYIHPAARIFEFALGMAAAQLWLRHGAPLQRLPVLAATLLEAAALALAYAGLTVFVQRYSQAYAQGEVPAAALKWLVASGSAPWFALLTVVFAAGRGLISRVLSFRPLVILGEISFALYLCHQILFRALAASGSLPSYGGPAAQFAAYCIMAVGLSYALHRLVELPCQRGLLNVLAPRKLVL